MQGLQLSIITIKRFGIETLRAGLQEQSNSEDLSQNSNGETSDGDRTTVSRLWSDFTDCVSDCVTTVTDRSKHYISALDSIIRSSEAGCKNKDNNENTDENKNASACELQGEDMKPNSLITSTSGKEKEANNKHVLSEAQKLGRLLELQKAKYIPFCEEYDGRPVRKSQTISSSIKDLIESRQREEEKNLVMNRFIASKSMDEMVKHAAMPERLEKRSCSFSAHDTCKMQRRPSIIPEMEDGSMYSPHLSKRFNAKRKASIRENNYMAMKNELKLHVPENFQKSLTGTIQISIQYLLMTNRLKVVIKSITDIPEEELRQTPYTKYYVKVCIMPRKGKRELKTMKVKGADEVKFNTELYFNQIEFASVHLLALRFQVWLESGRFFPNRRCSGETLVWLDEVNVMDKVELVENLCPYM